MFEPSATGPAGAVRFRRRCASSSTAVLMLPTPSDSLPVRVTPEGTEVRTSVFVPSAASLSAAASPSVTVRFVPGATPEPTVATTMTLNEALRAR